jgi:hypothetical protein
VYSLFFLNKAPTAAVGTTTSAHIKKSTNAAAADASDFTNIMKQRTLQNTIMLFETMVVNSSPKLVRKCTDGRWRTPLALRRRGAGPADMRSLAVPLLGRFAARAGFVIRRQTFVRRCQSPAVSNGSATVLKCSD